MAQEARHRRMEPRAWRRRVRGEARADAQPRARSHPERRRRADPADRQRKRRTRQRRHDLRTVRRVRPAPAGRQLRAGAGRAGASRSIPLAPAARRSGAWPSARRSPRDASADRGRRWWNGSPRAISRTGHACSGMSCRRCRSRSNRRQHLMINVGVRIPVNERDRPQHAGDHLLPVGLVRRRTAGRVAMRHADRDARAAVAIGWPPSWLAALFFSLPGAASPQVADPPVRLPAGHPDTMFVTSHECVRLPQRPDHADRRGRVHRRVVARLDDGQFVARSRTGRRRCGAKSSTIRRRRRQIEDECAICHMPMSRTKARAGKPARRDLRAPADRARAADEDDRLAADGVSCSVCHQIGPERLGTRDSFNGGFVLAQPTPDGERRMFGPFEVDRGPPDDHAVGDRHDAGRGEAPPRIRGVRHLPYALYAGAWARRAKCSGSSPSRCRISSGSTVRSARSGAASRATCRRSRSRRASPPCSARSGWASGGTRSSAATSSCSACSIATATSWAWRRCRRSSRRQPAPRLRNCSSRPLRSPLHAPKATPVSWPST